MLHKYIKTDDYYLQEKVNFSQHFPKIKEHIEAGNSLSNACIARFAGCTARTVRNHISKDIELRKFIEEMRAIELDIINNNIVHASMNSKDTDSRLLIYRHKQANKEEIRAESAVDSEFAKEYGSIASEKTQARFDCLTKYYNNNKISLEQYNAHLNAIKLMQDAVVTPQIEAILEARAG